MYKKCFCIKAFFSRYSARLGFCMSFTVNFPIFAMQLGKSYQHFENGFYGFPYIPK